jgi:DNA modification methylase
MSSTNLEYTDKILQGDVIEQLQKLPGEFVDCVVTSPPYWGLRDYGVEGQIGLEAHPQQYIDKIVDVFAEIKRVLRSDGTVFLNLGDSYCHSSTGGVDLRTAHGSNSILGHLPQTHCGMNREYFDGKWLQEKQKMLIPERIAIAMQDDGWILRNAIVWHKINHMPESVQDRLTRSYETVFFFTKSKRYFFNLDAIRKENIQATLKRVAFAKKKNETKGRKSVQQSLNPKGANPGDVWSLTTEGNQQYSDVKKHYAAFPKGLVRRCLACGCRKDGLVLDPFAGSGTTLYVARKMALHYLGIELNPEYIKIAKKRLDKIPARLDSFIQPMEVCVK